MVAAAAAGGAPGGGAGGWEAALGQAMAGGGGSCGVATAQHGFSFRRPVALLEVQVPAPVAPAAGAASAGGGQRGLAGLQLHVLLKARALPAGDAQGAKGRGQAAAGTALKGGAAEGADAQGGIYGFRGAGHSAGPSAATAGALGGSFSAISRLVHGPGAQPAAPSSGARPSSATQQPQPLPQLLQPSDGGSEDESGEDESWGEGDGEGMPPLTPEKPPGALPAAAKEPAGAVAAEAPAAPFAVQLVSQSPCVVMVDGFLPPELCQQLIELARPRLIRSRVASGARQATEGAWMGPHSTGCLVVVQGYASRQVRRWAAAPLHQPACLPPQAPRPPPAPPGPPSSRATWPSTSWWSRCVRLGLASRAWPLGGIACAAAGWGVTPSRTLSVPIARALAAADESRCGATHRRLL